MVRVNPLSVVYSACTVLKFPLMSVQLRGVCLTKHEFDLRLCRKEESAIQSTASWITGAASTLAQSMAAAKKGGGGGGGEERAPLLAQDSLDGNMGLVRLIWRCCHCRCCWVPR
jgi:hypothetical protein